MLKDRNVNIYKLKDTTSEVLIALGPKSVVYQIIDVDPFSKVTYDKIVGYIKNNDIESKTTDTHYELKLHEDKFKTNKFSDSIKIYKDRVYRNLLNNHIYINSNKLIQSYISSGFEIEFINTFKKRIKYITFNVQAYNRVDDKVDGIKSKKFVGPINENDIFTASPDDIWFNSHETIEYFKITSITLQFIDNTILKNVKYKTTNDDMKYNLILYKLYAQL